MFKVGERVGASAVAADEHSLFVGSEKGDLQIVNKIFSESD